jgi:hypothetical protein
MLASGATIHAGKNALTYGVPEMLDTYDAATRGRLGSMIRAFGTGMLGRGRELNEAIRTASGAQKPFQALAATVLARPGAAHRFVPSLDQMATTMAASSKDFSQMFGPMASAMRPFADERRATQAALEQAPSALSAASAGLERGRMLLDATRALAEAANETLPSAPRGLRAATAFLRTSHSPLRRAAELLRAARPAAPAMLRMTGALSPVLDPLRRAFDDLAPMMTYIGRYGCDIRHLGAVFRSMTGIGATPGTEAGAIGQFRFQLIPSPEENAGSAKPGPPRVGYAAPCAYLTTPDSIIDSGAGR